MPFVVPKVALFIKILQIYNFFFIYLKKRVLLFVKIFRTFLTSVKIVIFLRKELLNGKKVVILQPNSRDKKNEK